MPADPPAIVCGCCGRGPELPPERLRDTHGIGRLCNLPRVMCSDCMAVWYGEGETDPEVIREMVLHPRPRKTHAEIAMEADNAWAC